MTARDSNNKIIREADWISYNNRVYQVNDFIKEDSKSIPCLILWLQFVKKNSKIKTLKYPLFVLGINVTKVDPPIAYNVTDND